MLEKVDRLEAVELPRAATTLDEDNWQHHYALAHTLLHHRRHDEALLALRPLHRANLDGDARKVARGARVDARWRPRPRVPRPAAAAPRAYGAAGGAARPRGGGWAAGGVILYKLGPKVGLDNLVLSLTQLTTYFNAYRYLIVVAHDLPFKAARQRVRDAATGAPSPTCSCATSCRRGCPRRRCRRRCSASPSTTGT